ATTTISISGSVRNDFNGDNRSDLLLQNSSVQHPDVMVELLNGTTVAASATITTPRGTAVEAAADFNSDGKADILVQTDDGRPQIWEMNGSSIVASAVLPNPGKFWHAIGTGDFNNDGMSDILFQNKDGTPLIWEMNGTSIIASATLTNPG